MREGVSAGWPRPTRNPPAPRSAPGWRERRSARVAPGLPFTGSRGGAVGGRSSGIGWAARPGPNGGSRTRAAS
eukprot:7352616-Lingulodinium_polyedra.AAC.1